MTAPLWQSEFPDYAPEDMPIIPASWDDASWHNDACPCFEAPNGLRIFTDYASGDERDGGPDCPRFSVQRDTDEAGSEALHEGDDWQAVLDFVASYVPPAPVAPIILPQAGDLDALSQELATYAEQNGLALACAYEMHADAMRRADIAKVQGAWLAHFINRWEAEEERILREERGPIEAIPATPENVDKLARAFMVQCRAQYSAQEMELIRRRNREHADAGDLGTCATHDFADANMIMLDAFEDAFGRKPALLCEGGTEAEIEADCLIWNEAWTLAKTRDLTAPNEATRAAAILARDALWAHMVETFHDEAAFPETVFWAPYVALRDATQ